MPRNASAERALLQSLICCAAHPQAPHGHTQRSLQALKRAQTVLHPWSATEVIYGVVRAGADSYSEPPERWTVADPHDGVTVKVRLSRAVELWRWLAAPALMQRRLLTYRSAGAVVLEGSCGRCGLRSCRVLFHRRASASCYAWRETTGSTQICLTGMVEVVRMSA